MTYQDRLDTLDGTRTDTDALADAILNANQPEYVLDRNGAPRSLRFPDGDHVDLDALEPRPARHRGSTRLDNVPSFLGWLDDNAGAAVWPEFSCSVYADRRGNRIVAVLNDHDAGAPGWRDYRALYEVRPTEEWLHWSRNVSGEFYSAVDFADIIEDYSYLIAEPSTADVLDLVRNFKAVQRVEFSDEIRDDNGDRALLYTSETSTGELIIPNSITLGIIVYEGASARSVEARFRYRINGGRALFGVRIAGVEAIENEAFEELTGSIGENLPDGVPIYMGVPTG